MQRIFQKLAELRLSDSRFQNFTLLVLTFGALSNVILRLFLPLAAPGEVYFSDILLRGPLSFLAIVVFSQITALGTGRFFLILLSLALLVHFPGNLTFHWDEWDALWRFHENSWGSAFRNFEAHVIPLFLLFWFAELMLLDFYYPALLIVSALLLAANGLLVNRFLDALLPDGLFDPRAVRILSFLYVTSALQTEASQWSFIQSVLLQNATTLLAAIFAIRWHDSRSVHHALLCFFLTFASPLFHGAGFVTIGIVGLSLVTRHLLTWPNSAVSFKSFIFRLFRFLLFISVAVAAGLMIYFTFEDKRVSVDTALTVSKRVTDTSLYILHGSTAVALVRGLSLFPSLFLNEEVVDKAFQTIGLAYPSFISRPADALIALGVVIWLGLLIVSLCFKKRRRISLILFFCGLAIIVASLSVPALGRARFPYYGSLFGRYHTRTLVGLALVLIPLVSFVFFEARTKLRTAGFLALFLFCLVQLRMGLRYYHYTELSHVAHHYICRAAEEPSMITQEDVHKNVCPEVDTEAFIRLVDGFGLKCYRE